MCLSKSVESQLRGLSYLREALTNVATSVHHDQAGVVVVDTETIATVTFPVSPTRFPLA
jgi:hypothetical protein